MLKVYIYALLCIFMHKEGIPIIMRQSRIVREKRKGKESSCTLRTPLLSFVQTVESEGKGEIEMNLWSQKIKRLIQCSVIAVLAIASTTTPGHAANNKEKKTPVKVEKTKDGARASYVPRSAGVYAEVGGRPRSHNEPKGEQHVGVGFVFKF